MTNPKKKRNTGCPIAFGLDTFGDRWSLLIIRDMLMTGAHTYGSFLDGAEKFATNILADRLKYLEADGIIHKSRHPDNRRKFIYRLTEKGLDLAPIILEMIQWSEKYDSNTLVNKKVVDRINTDKDGFLADIRSRATAP